jgi:hypothetical protein
VNENAPAERSGHFHSLMRLKLCELIGTAAFTPS